MSIAINRTGRYGVVEPNHMSAPRNGQVYAQLPAASTITQLEQGQFVKYDYANGVCNFTGDGPWMMVYNEEKLYDERKWRHKDFVYIPGDFYDGKMYPRVFDVKAGDIFTTDTVDAGTYAKGDKLKVGTDGILEPVGAQVPTDQHVFQVVDETTLPDGVTNALKIRVIL